MREIQHKTDCRNLKCEVCHFEFSYSGYPHFKDEKSGNFKCYPLLPYFYTNPDQ